MGSPNLVLISILLSSWSILCLPQQPCAQQSGYQPSGQHWYRGGPGVYPAPSNPWAPFNDVQPNSITNPLNQSAWWNLLNPLNASQPDNPVNSLNRWQPWNPINPANAWVPNSAANPLNRANPFAIFGPVGPDTEE